VIDQAEIRALIPHAGTMCLLERVERWDQTAIACSTTTHRDAENPLRRDGALAAIHLIEYGAQAVAIHGGLIGRAAGDKSAKPGMLTALRDCRLHVDRVDDIAVPLTIAATKIAASGAGSMYQFEVKAGERVLAGGRVSVMTVAAL
jgi:predicted hotdog family 3-hydroxylacyl-ACP dehydratase